MAGYGMYIDLIRPLIDGKQIINTGMTKEVERVQTALEAALEGRQVAIVSSGDPGIYAMAGLALELCAARGIAVVSTPSACRQETLCVEVVPGIPALCAGAALLGAPLTHDFATVSLSDLLTPWEVIEQRLDAAARADFVIVIYNPKSKKRRLQLNLAQEIIRRHRGGDTPVGIVTGAMRDNQCVHITTLDQLPHAEVDMQTTVFIGNDATCHWGQWMFTPRGYTRKYQLGPGQHAASTDGQ